jgi:hypothetical protein
MLPKLIEFAHDKIRRFFISWFFVIFGRSNIIQHGRLGGTFLTTGQHQQIRWKKAVSVAVGPCSAVPRSCPVPWGWFCVQRWTASGSQAPGEQIPIRWKKSENFEKWWSNVPVTICWPRTLYGNIWKSHMIY